jgi:hypothetical protein
MPSHPQEQHYHLNPYILKSAAKKLATVKEVELQSGCSFMSAERRTTKEESTKSAALQQTCAAPFPV